MSEQNSSEGPRRYVWPWFVLAALVLGAALAVLWMTAAVRHIRAQKVTDPLAAPTPPSASSH